MELISDNEIHTAIFLLFVFVILVAVTIKLEL